METPLQTPELQQPRRRVSTMTMIVTMVACLAVGSALWFLVAPVPRSATMSSAEQEYASKLEIGNLAMTRAENFLHQEVTTVNGEVYNRGSEAVAGLRVTLEFADDLNQVVLRETHGVLGTPEQPLPPGEHRAFEISFEHVPASWNMQQPAVRVTYLRLASHK